MKKSRLMLIALTTLAVLTLASPPSALATTYEVSAGEDLFAVLSGLQAGDEVIVHDGVYDTGGFFEVDWQGTAAAPIVIRAADGARPHIRGVSNQNIINLSGSYVTLRGFEMTAGSHGIRLATCDHITLEGLEIHDVRDVGISCNRPGTTCDSLIVRDNEIYDTGVNNSGPGEGMYIGCNDAACVVSNSVFEHNYIHDMGGTQGDGIEIKTGSYNNAVRDNVIVRTNYPAITMYGFPAGAGAPNIVERNLVWGTVDNGIQIVGQVIVRNNIVIDAGLNGIHSKPSQGFDPVDLEITHNTIYSASNACLKSNNWGGLTGQVVANNALYCQGGQAIDFNGGVGADTVIEGNVVLGSENAPGGVSPGVSDADLGDPAGGVLYPPPGSPLIDAGVAAFSANDDFNGLPRDGASPDAGAYEHSEGRNPGWALSEDFKTLAEPPVMVGDDPVESDVMDGVSPEDVGGGDTMSAADTRPGDVAVGQDTQGPASDGETNPDTGGSSSGGDVGAPPSGDGSEEGCGCRTRGGDGGHAPLGWLAALLGVGLIGRVSRRERLRDAR